ncbi:uncharacterized protein ARMOST_21393 [Armillaria ostoyae]|uniref:Uncharacterized protein n=1 Tax=Armillaria ostoyae TaxID=47428 RepID=A0A284SA30_ARMOS|nr:uncharacterized protein ARMOST_21393 [Armillaria ostoyae]
MLGNAYGVETGFTNLASFGLVSAAFDIVNLVQSKLNLRLYTTGTHHTGYQSPPNHGLFTGHDWLTPQPWLGYVRVCVCSYTEYNAYLILLPHLGATVLMDFVEEGDKSMLAFPHFRLVSNIKNRNDNSEEYVYEGSNLEMPGYVEMLTFMPYPLLDASTTFVHRILLRYLTEKSEPRTMINAAFTSA